MKKCPEKDLAERLRQFSVVCKVAIQTTWGLGSTVHNLGLKQLGRDKYGLDKYQVFYCVGRAWDHLEEVRHAERERNRSKLELAA